MSIITFGNNNENKSRKIKYLLVPKYTLKEGGNKPRSKSYFKKSKSKFFKEKINLVNLHFIIPDSFDEEKSKKFLESKNTALNPLILDDEIDIEESHVSDVLSMIKNMDSKKIITTTLYHKSDFKDDTKFCDNEDTTFV